MTPISQKWISYNGTSRVLGQAAIDLGGINAHDARLRPHRAVSEYPSPQMRLVGRGMPRAGGAGHSRMLSE